MRNFDRIVIFCAMQLQLSIEEKSDLHRLQRNLVGTPDYVRITCTLMFDNGRSPKFISANLDISPTTIYRYINEYQAGGIELLLENGNNGYWGMLSSHKISVLRKELKKHVYTNAKSVSEWIRKTFGVPYTSQGTVDLLNRIGFTYKKTTKVPCETDAFLQEAFVTELTETLAQMEEDSVVCYADGVHPTHNSHSTYVWIEKGERLEQPTISGRDRININGLLNVHDVTDVIAHGCKSANIQSARKLYEAALEKHPGSTEYLHYFGQCKILPQQRTERMGERDKNKTNIPAAIFSEPELDRTVVEVSPEKIINTGFYQTKEEFRKAVKRSFENIDDFREEFGVTSNSQFSIS